MKEHDATDLFLSLTPDKVLEAVEAGGVETNPVCYALNSFENRVYEIELSDESRLVSKFYRPGRWSREQILEEHQYLEDCIADEIPVCPVRPFPDGSTLKTNPDGIHYCLFHRRGGRAPDEVTTDMVERLGMLTARLHIAGGRRVAEHRVRIDGDTYVRAHLDWYGVTGNGPPPDLKTRYWEAANRIADIADQYLSETATQRVHGDLHLGNLIQRDSVLWALDFDDFVVGPPVQDLWLLLPGRDAWTQRQRQVFVDAYCEFKDFDRSSLRLIEPLRGLRAVHYAAWLARRWHDPVFPKTWPHFGTRQYWEQETVDLEEILHLTLKGDMGLQAGAPAEEEEELTNKDFFWDMDD